MIAGLLSAAFVVVVCVFAFALCKVAGDGDRRDDNDMP